MADVSIYAPILVEVVEWISQFEHLSTKEVRLSFVDGELQLYDYEDGGIHSRMPLSYFTQIDRHDPGCTGNPEKCDCF